MFLKVYRALDRYNPKYRFSTWLLRVAQNAAIDLLRKRRLKLVPMQRVSVDGAVQEWEFPSEERDPYRPQCSGLLPCEPVTRGQRDGPRLRRSLGQHHLRNLASAAPAVDFLDLEGRTVIEIGPGGGVLTRLLLDRGASRVIACELDPAWALKLRRRIIDPRLVLVVGDGCDLRYERAPAAARIAGNLPYNVATRIVAAVLERAPTGARAVFLVQREVADRLTAKPGDSAFGSLSVLTAARAAARRLSLVLPGSFVPPPAVTSAFIGLERTVPPIGEGDWPAFAALVRTAFSRRRKTLLNNLRPSVGRVAAEAALATLELPPRVRAERLGVPEFVALFREVGRPGV